jgi:enoyl-CoA hydratase
LSSDCVLVESDGAVRLLTLNRPGSMNAFDDDLHRELPLALERVQDDPGARAIVITGAGRAFSAGGNIEDFPLLAADLERRRRTLRAGRRLFQALISVHLPVVAAVNGPAVGLGCTVATGCDIVFISESAFMADPHVTVALVAGDGGAVTWPACTSLLKAKQYLLTGDRMSATEAVAAGLANFVVPPAEVVSSAIAFAQRLASLPPQAVQDTKMVLNQQLRSAAVAALDFGLAAESQSHDTDEYAQAPLAFARRRG